jgi:hypothetical protein
MKNKRLSTRFVFTALVSAVVIVILIQEICSPSPGTGKQPVLDSSSYWKNVANNAVASLHGAQDDFGIIEERYKDSIAKIYKTKPRLIKEIVVASTKSESDIPPVGEPEWTIAKNDSDYFSTGNVVGTKFDTTSIFLSNKLIKRGNVKQKFENSYYTADVQIGDSSYMHLVGYDTTTLIWKRVKQELQLDISHANPDVKIIGLAGYRIPDKKPKRWGIGAQIGMGYSIGFKPSIYIGVGLQRTIIRF